MPTFATKSFIISSHLSFLPTLRSISCTSYLKVLPDLEHNPQDGRVCDCACLQYSLADLLFLIPVQFQQIFGLSCSSALFRRTGLPSRFHMPPHSNGASRCFAAVCPHVASECVTCLHADSHTWPRLFVKLPSSSSGSMCFLMVRRLCNGFRCTTKGAVCQVLTQSAALFAPHTRIAWQEAGGAIRHGLCRTLSDLSWCRQRMLMEGINVGCVLSGPSRRPRRAYLLSD